ncbi:MAG: peptidoglycan-associated lipoprotein Pal [Gammaproteobacteria bacterium]|nr:peptidoglycan-associated lipoprotein Pal [Gammaproteobacteria bacterium]NNF61544.1 peptidoglycan-associated lipoprotein Pal [Gammaproteobacteria bacterium]
MINMRSVFLTALALMLVACGGQQAVETPPDTMPEPPPVTQPPPPPPPPPGPTPEEMREMALQQLLGQRTLYFDFDTSEIRREFVDIIEAHARNLARNPSQRIMLEGHCDERGSREYNIGLGERRAHAVRRALLLQGVSASQVSTVSYGEERPADPGHNESAWSRNRRVEIIYR